MQKKKIVNQQIPSTTKTGEIVLRDNSVNGTIKAGPNMFCIEEYCKNGSLCYFWDHRGRQLSAFIRKVGKVVGGTADLEVNFVLDSGKYVEGTIKRYNPGTSPNQREAKGGVYSYVMA
jgi:hypothetical protein